MNKFPFVKIIQDTASRFKGGGRGAWVVQSVQQ